MQDGEVIEETELQLSDIQNVELHIFNSDPDNPHIFDLDPTGEFQVPVTELFTGKNSIERANVGHFELSTSW